ncbi:uncharacterized mitochondrial protein AtMg00810-like [Arachis hypogaea]|uniref:uncharacterized mitochondrial protein AtMg00810-like n=1 Tax=Arachis hypogaea TaxID=3818 RepID=UPI003B20DF77
MEVARSATKISLYQRKYTLDLLEEFGLLDTKPASTPIDYSKPLSKTSGTALSDLTPYRRLIGRLIYLTNTRPGICFTISKLSQYLDCAIDAHFTVGLYVFRYLKGSPATSLLFNCLSDLKLHGYSDSDWKICLDSHRSISIYCFFLDSALISWKSKKQIVVARSSAEVEYRVLAIATCECAGFDTFLVILVSNLSFFLLSFAIINLPSISQQIRYFINGQNTLKLIVIRFKIELKIRLKNCSLFPPHTK